MEYCLGNDDGTAGIFDREPDLDLDGDGVPDAISLDFDGDGLADDALADLDGDGVIDHLLIDVGEPGAQRFTDDGSGTWAIPVGGSLRWFGLGGVEHTGGPLVDFTGDGTVDDWVLDTDGDGVADRVFIGDGAGGYRDAYVDTNGDGRWDVLLRDADGDGAADGAHTL